jgi:hypothetical protein
MFALIKVISADAPTGNIYDDAPVLIDGNADWGMTVSETGGVITVAVISYGSDSSYHWATATMSAGAYHLVIAKYDGTTITIEVDGVAGTPAACPGPLAIFTGSLQAFYGYGGSHFLNADVIELDVAPRTYGASEIADVYTYINSKYALTL